MEIVLFNPAHNGDVFFCLEIVKNIIYSNPDYTYDIRLSCSHYIYKELINTNVSLTNYENLWQIDRSILLINDDNKFNKLWVYNNNILYINCWKCLVDDNSSCINISSRVDFIKQLFTNINNTINTNLQFNINDYKDLIPMLPEIDNNIINNILNNILNYKTPIIFIYNLNGCSNICKNIDYDKFIMYLLSNYIDHKIIIARKSNIHNENIINLETDHNIKPELNGYNLVLYSYIAERSKIVFFNPTSMFVFGL
jgi:hypothetical protein